MESIRWTAFVVNREEWGRFSSFMHLRDPPGYPLVLKYCRETDDEQLRRFRREVRLLSEFRGNSRIVQIWDQNLESDPPYFVMRYYADGDLATKAGEIRSSYEVQERYFLRMIDCVQELHARDEFHRDLKPQNFLRDGDEPVVSDLGLSTEISSAKLLPGALYGGGLMAISSMSLRGKLHTTVHYTRRKPYTKG